MEESIIVELVRKDTTPWTRDSSISASWAKPELYASGVQLDWYVLTGSVRWEHQQQRHLI
jgi:hypothetical protein